MRHFVRSKAIDPSNIVPSPAAANLGPHTLSAAKAQRVDPYSTLRMSVSQHSPMLDTPDLCAIVLAGGEGKRLRPFVQRLRGDDLPKQYVKLAGERSLLETTLGRVERLIRPERVFVVSNSHHLKYPEARRQIAERPHGTVILQPANKDTGAGIFVSLMHVLKRYPEAGVAIFPSDHFVENDALFIEHVYLAHYAVQRHPLRLVLLGAHPNQPDPDYGYILPGERLKSLSPFDLHQVTGFVEKPRVEAAWALIRKGALWNTMVIVARGKILVGLLRKKFSAAYSAFERVYRYIGSPFERATVQEAYTRMEPMNFSKDFLEELCRDQPSRLLALALKGVLWSDLGCESRVRQTQAHIGGGI
ncbi:MAG: NTP transferase domain-containing protein [Deltaproteobacteria bacterium]|nr:NTP transferase domain-containing protein [Deltaproteobacteria bacterium]